MDHSARFVPVACRDLIFVGPTGYEMPIHVAVGAPYAEVKAEEVTMPGQLRMQCVAEYDAITRSHAGVFPASQRDLACRTEAEITAAREALLQILRADRACP